MNIVKIFSIITILTLLFLLYNCFLDNVLSFSMTCITVTSAYLVVDEARSFMQERNAERKRQNIHIIKK